MTLESELRDELVVLRRGRGLREPKLRDRLGPRLTELIRGGRSGKTAILGEIDYGGRLVSAERFPGGVTVAHVRLPAP